MRNNLCQRITQNSLSLVKILKLILKQRLNYEITQHLLELQPYSNHQSYLKTADSPQLIL